MKQNPLSPNDPKLTAYALGELDLEENALVAEIIKGDVAAQATVEEIRLLAGQLEGALENEPALPETSSAPTVSFVAPPVANESIFPRVYWFAGLAAACVMTVIATQPRGGARFQVDQQRGTQAQLLPRGTSSDTPAADELLVPSFELPKAPVVDNRRRALSSGASDVKPAPLRDDGLQRWRSVTDNRAPAAGPLASLDLMLGAASNDLLAYQPGDYKNIGKMNMVGPADRSSSKQYTHYSVNALYETVPVSTLVAAKNSEEDTTTSDASESSLLSSNESRYRELLALTIRYKMPAVDLSQWAELPQISISVNPTFIDENFKLALDTTKLGNQVKEAPHKNSTYDQILSWAEENQETIEGAPEPRHESIDAVRKPKRATVE